MKKILIVTLLVIFITPSIALASWWNPFTWKVFKKREPAPQVQVINTENNNTPEEKISELQKQLDELKNKSVQNIKKDNINKKNTEVKNDSNQNKISGDLLKTQTPNNGSLDSNKKVVQSNARLLTDEEKSQIKKNADSVIAQRNKWISDIQKTKDVRANSEYIIEYFELFQACDLAKKYFEEDKEITLLMLKAVNSDAFTGEQVQDIYNEWFNIITESNKNFPIIIGGLSSLTKMTNELITAIIEKEAIEEVARRNNIPLNYNGMSVEYYANERLRLEKKADDYVKSLIPKEKERVNNFLIILY